MVERIGFVGAGGTGKTTTAKAFSQVLGLEMVASSARAVFKEFGLNFEDDQADRTPEFRLKLQTAILKKRLQISRDTEKGVFDRTTLDTFCYCLIQGHEAMGEEIRELEEKVLIDLTTYDLLVYFPLYDWPIESDGMRTGNLAQRKMHATLITGFLVSWACGEAWSRLSLTAPVLILPDISVENRVDLILKRVRTLKGFGREGTQAEARSISVAEGVASQKGL